MATKTKGSKKLGRNLKGGQNLKYKNERKHEKSHLRRINIHLAAFPGDKVAVEAQKAYKVKLGVYKAA